MENCDLTSREYLEWRGTKYYFNSYQTEYELFDLTDKGRKNPLIRIKKNSEAKTWAEISFVIYHGVQYSADKIEEGKCYYHNNSKNFDVELCFVSEVYTVIALGEGKREVRVVYQNLKDNETLPSDLEYHVEEMANGNYMIAYLTMEKSIEQTVVDLQKLYGSRIQIGEPDIRGLLLDYYIRQIIIDGIVFKMEEDYDIVTINPEEEAGRRYIVEIVDYFNLLESKKYERIKENT